MFQLQKNVVSRVVVLLMTSSKYDDQGFVLRYSIGGVRTSGLSVVADLTREALKGAGVKVSVRTYEDSIFLNAVALSWFRLTWFFSSCFWRLRGINQKLIVGFVSVQSHQFPRAEDLIRRWQKRGAICLIGGPHVTASITAMLDGLDSRGGEPIPCLHRMPEEIAALQRRGVVIFHGEAEPHLDGSNVWRDALSDIIQGRQQSLYRGGQPDITSAPLPELTSKTRKRRIPVSCSRGCPFKCRFCSVLAINGGAMRGRRASIVIEYFKALCDRYGRAYVFVVDDNLARSRYLYEILKGLADLRAQGHEISFMAQVDVAACLDDERLIPALATAGCSQLFLGVESLNKKNLIAASKTQNVDRDLRVLCELCHAHNIIVHAAYMIGFQFDTPESVAAAVDKLHDFGVDHVTYFIRGPIPGSEDWARMVAAGVYIDPDMNIYGSERCATTHELLMSREECEAAYHDAWRQSLKLSRMIAARKRFTDPDARRELVIVHLWYWWATRVERIHPMTSGLYRFRPYFDRRPGAPRLSFVTYFGQEIWRHMQYIGYVFAVLFLFGQIEYEIEFDLSLSARKDMITGRLRGARDWAQRIFGQVIHRG